MNMKTALCLIIGLLMLGATPTTKPTKPIFYSAIQVCASVPPEMFPAKAAGWTQLKRDRVNEIIMRDVKGQQAHISLDVIEIKTEPTAIILVGADMIADTWVRYVVGYDNTPANQAMLSKLERFKPVMVDGIIRMAGFAQPKPQDDAELVIVIDARKPTTQPLDAKK